MTRFLTFFDTKDTTRTVSPKIHQQFLPNVLSSQKPLCLSSKICMIFLKMLAMFITCIILIFWKKIQERMKKTYLEKHVWWFSIILAFFTQFLLAPVILVQLEVSNINIKVKSFRLLLRTINNLNIWSKSVIVRFKGHLF